MKARRISSAANPKVKDAAKLRQKKRRYQTRRFLAEGEDLLEAAIDGGHEPRQVFVVEEAEREVSAMLAGGSAAQARGEIGVDVFICSETVMQKLSVLGSGSRVISVFDFLERKLGGQAPKPGAGKEAAAEALPLVYLAGVRDPGNVGTIMRSSTALGAAGLILSPESADPYSNKAQRAAMGAVFQVPLYLDTDPQELLDWAGASGIPVVCADAARGKAPWEAGAKGVESVLAGRFVLVLGSERRGLPRELLQRSDIRLRIPQLPDAESLNVAMAGTIILYEASRQRVARGLPFGTAN